MKKLLPLILALAIAGGTVGTVYAGTNVFVNNTQVQFDVAPITENGRTLVQLRPIAEALEIPVLWIEEEQKVSFFNDTATFFLTINSTTVEKFNHDTGITTTEEIDVAPTIHNGVTLVPLRFISESLDIEIFWDEPSQSIFLGEVPNVANDTVNNASNTTPNQNATPREQNHLEQAGWIRYSGNNRQALYRRVAAGEVIYYDGSFWLAPHIANMQDEIVQVIDIPSGTPNPDWRIDPDEFLRIVANQ